MRKLILVAVGALAVAGFSLTQIAPAEAASAYGTWKRPNGTKAKTWNCGGKMCAKVITGKNKGFVMFTGIKKISPNTWKGNMKHPKMGKNMNFNGTVILKGSRLSVKGCMIGGLFCDAEKWSK